ncbi:MAG: hypothetical protein WCS87_10975 [Methylococcaceae bacterium]
MNMSKYLFKVILLLMSLGIPLTVSADAASDTVAAIAADPAHAAEITAAAVSAAVAANPDQGAAIAAAIVTAAIRANPTMAIAITTAVITANPGLAAAITAAAIEAAPKQAAEIGAAAIAAAPNQAKAIVSAFQVAVGAPIPTENVSESTVNTIAMSIDVALSAIADCGGTQACVASVFAQIAAQSSSPAAAAAIINEVKREISSN